MPMTRPSCLIVAGPNGAGKTTFASSFLPREGNCTHFINADLIAGGLSPFAPERAALQAGRLVIQSIRAAVRHRINFAFETTLAGQGYLQDIHDWREAGYFIHMIYLRLPTPEMAVSRVRARVRQGGHHVPEQDIHRRFVRGWTNFQEHYRKLAHYWQVLDANSRNFSLIEEGNNP